MLMQSLVPMSTFDFAALRAREFSRLDDQGMAYLDFAASGLYGASQVAAEAERLRHGIFGNPHSEHAPSQAGALDLERARAAALAFFDADPNVYELCLTANTSAALKLVAESYPFSSRRGLVLSADNHNSVNGARRFAQPKGAPVTTLPLDGDLRLDDAPQRLRDAVHRHGPGLLAFPVQSNFSGVRHDLGLIDLACSLGCDVLIDAAGTGASGGISLRDHPADFLAFSFYKLFGLPTGLGALIAKREALERLQRPWFAGGTVDFVSIEHGLHQLRPGHEGFEDGTPNFLAAGAIESGFRFLEQVPSAALSARLQALTAYALDRMTALTHADGAQGVRLYGPRGLDDRGGTVAFNLLDARGRVVPYCAVEARARDMRVAIRGGCFCNPGAAEAAFDFARYDVAACLNALGDSFTIPLFQARLGPDATVGALRLSVGLPTSFADIDRAVDMMAEACHRPV